MKRKFIVLHDDIIKEKCFFKLLYNDFLLKIEIELHNNNFIEKSFVKSNEYNANFELKPYFNLYTYSLNNNVSQFFVIPEISKKLTFFSRFKKIKSYVYTIKIKHYGRIIGNNNLFEIKQTNLIF